MIRLRLASSLRKFFFISITFLLVLRPSARAETFIMTVGGLNSLKGCNGLALTGLQLYSWLLDLGEPTQFQRVGLPGIELWPHPVIEPIDFPFFIETENIVRNTVTAALDRNAKVIILGYSHGATLVLRVVNTLPKEKLARVKVVTVDWISVAYPLPTPFGPHPSSVPPR